MMGIILRFAMRVLLIGGGAFICTALLLYFRYATSVSDEVLVDDMATANLVIETDSEVTAQFVVYNKTGKRIRLHSEAGWGCDVQLCTEWDAELLGAIEAGESRIIPVSIVVHREGAFERYHDLFFTDGKNVWSAKLRIQGEGKRPMNILPTG